MIGEEALEARVLIFFGPFPLGRINIRIDICVIYTPKLGLPSAVFSYIGESKAVALKQLFRR